jgi:hypothetical protein
VERAQRHRRLQPELVVEHAARAAVDLERIGLAAGAVQREHQRSGQHLQGGVLGEDGFQVRDHVAVVPEGERQLGTFGERGDPQLPQPNGLRDRPLLGGEVAQGIPAPELESGVEGVQVLLVVKRRGGCCLAPGPSYPVSELNRVDRVARARGCGSPLRRGSPAPERRRPSRSGGASRPGSAGRSSDRPGESSPTRAGPPARWPARCGRDPEQRAVTFMRPWSPARGRGRPHRL